MSKHLRTLHGINPDQPKSKRKVDQDNPILTQLPLGEGIEASAIPLQPLSTSVFVPVKPAKQPRAGPSSHPPPKRTVQMATDDELRLDPELDEVVLRVRERTQLPTSLEEDLAVKGIRDRYPRHTRSRRSKHPDVDSEDSFDEGVSTQVSQSASAVAPFNKYMLLEPLNHPDDVPIVRSRWQARYIMAKAKLMLAEEENFLRRQKLEELQADDRRLDEIAARGYGTGSVYLR